MEASSDEAALLKTAINEESNNLLLKETRTTVTYLASHISNPLATDIVLKITKDSFENLLRFKARSVTEGNFHGYGQS